jgi:tetratricopeptide (TPR) repeat protein
MSKIIAFSRAQIFAFGLLLVWGLVKIPIEKKIDDTQKELRFGGRIPISQDIRDKIGQGAAIGLLAGFRGFISNLLFIQAHEHWEKQEWARMRNLLEVACTLQPRNIKFWELSAWHLAWNVSYAASINPNEPRDAARLRAQREWIRAGRELLERGVQANPDTWHLWFQLGYLISQKQEKFAESAEYFKKAASFPEAPQYIRRLVGYDLRKAGKLQEAYEWWLEMWKLYPERKDDTTMMWPAVEREIRALENEINIPTERRIFPYPPDATPSSPQP